MYSLRQSDESGLDQYGSSKRGNKLKVFGKGVIKAKPDLAEVIIGVVTESSELLAAQNENAGIAGNVINSLKVMGISDRFIQTSNYSIRPVYDYVDGKQVFRGYEVSNLVKVLLSNLDLAGKIIDTAVRNGANSVNGINFIVSDEKRYYYEALTLAIEDAQNKASVITGKLGLSLSAVPFEIIERNTTVARPMGLMASYKGGGTPIESGENEINAEIEITFMFS
jgi:uncharacterized protein YggE